MLFHLLVLAFGSNVSQSIILVKTHKTGSSTLNTILFRAALSRNWNVLLPAEERVDFSYPEPFRKNPAVTEAKAHSYDAILSHAVFDSDTMKRALRGDVFVLTSLRAPVPRLRSAFQYYNHDKFGEKPPSWSDLNTESVDCEGKNGMTCVNGQAFDLGWYASPEHEIAVTHHPDDHGARCDSEQFDTWMARMESQLSAVVIVEHFEESLVLFGRDFGLALHELVFIPKKMVFNGPGLGEVVLKPWKKSREVKEPLPALVGQDLELPKGSIAESITRENRCDEKLYAQYNKTLWHRWHLADEDAKSFLGPRRTLQQELTNLRRMNQEILDFCKEQETLENKLCNVLLMDSLHFTQYYMHFMDCRENPKCTENYHDANAMLCEAIDCSFHA
jgi:hypothetical protein